ncbi:MAG: hypothetical protein WD772_10660 [Pseudohongiellaceae bacterium]
MTFLRREFLISLLFGAGLASVLLITTAIYWPGLSGPLLLDDVVNLQALGEGGGVDDWKSLRRFVTGNESGPLGRPVSMVSFLIDAQDWPPRVAALKYTNLMIHLLCGVLVSWLAWILFRLRQVDSRPAAGLALVCAALWLLHPMNVSTALYVIQRMTQLMTLFGLGSLILYCKGRINLNQHNKRGALHLFLALAPFALLSVLSKENGVLLLLMIVVLEHTLFQFHQRNAWFRVWYRIGVLLPLTLVIVYLGYSIASGFDDYAYRPFGPWERLLTQSRILIIYLGGILLPFAADFGLFHDDLPISTSLFSPFSTIISLISILAVLILAFRSRRQHAVFSFAVFWFFGMHLMESTLLPLELYFEHRNYMAMLGPIFAVTWYGWTGTQSGYARRLRYGGQILATAVIVLFAGLTLQQTLLWGNTSDLFSHWSANHPDSIRAQTSAADFYRANGEPDKAIASLLQAHQVHSDELSIMLYLWNINCETGQPSLISIEEINASELLVNYVGNLNIHLQRMLELVRNRSCPIPTLETLETLFERIVELPQSDLRRSNLHRLFSEMYVLQGNLDGALIQLRRAFEIRPLAQFPMRQAVLAASAGNYQDSLVFLERARVADSARPVFQPSDQPEIDRLYEDVVRLTQTATSDQNQ